MSEDRKALADVLAYLADLNGSEWIKGDHPSEIDMRQRARNLQARLARIVHHGECRA